MTAPDRRQQNATQPAGRRATAGAAVAAIGAAALLAAAVFVPGVRAAAVAVLGVLYVQAACGRRTWQRRARAAGMSASRGPVPGSLDRGMLGPVVRDIWVNTVLALVPDPEPSWLTRWPDLADPFQREVAMRIGEQVAAFVSPERAVRVMCQAFRLHAGHLPAFPTADIPDGLAGELSGRVEQKVLQELRPAMISGDLVKIADAIPAAVVLLIDAALCYGLPFDQLFREVMRSNMTMASQPGNPDLIKGGHYVPPRITEVLHEACEAVSNRAGTGAPA